MSDNTGFNKPESKNKQLRPKRRMGTTDFNEAMNRPKIHPKNLSIEDRKFNEWFEKIKNSPINQNKKLRVKQTEGKRHEAKLE